jgi:glycosyltransferase involved in cell wall biosynthesis
MSKAITVVIPTYNRGRLLNETIPTYLQDEVARLVLVDDCSVDDTPRVARELAERYAPRILYVRNETNRKQAYSKNRGKALADTPYLYFGDDDSVLLPYSLAVLLETTRSEIPSGEPRARRGATTWTWCT